MSKTRTLDVRGLSCPQPALRTKQAIKELEGGIVEVLVDSRTSRDNVSRLAQKAGWNVTIEEQSEVGFKLVLER